MGIAANKFRLLFLTASKSDIEFKMLKLNQLRIGLMSSAEKFAAQQSNNIFQSGQHSDLYNGNTPGALPGFIGNPFVSQDEVPEGAYEAQMTVIHSMDKEYEIQIKKLETFHEAKKTEVDSVKELLKKNTEKEYKTFG